MREWYDSLEPREQLIVGIGALVAGLMLVFLIVWEPLAQRSARLDTEIANARELVVFMQRTEQEVRQLGRVAPGVAQANRSLLAIVDSSSKQTGMSALIKRIQPEGQTSVRLWIEDAPFDKLADWLHQLESQQQIKVDNGSLDRDEQSGTVKARLTLTRGAA